MVDAREALALQPVAADAQPTNNVRVEVQANTPGAKINRDISVSSLSIWVPESMAGVGRARTRPFPTFVESAATSCRRSGHPSP